MVMIAFEFGTPEARKIEIAKQLLNEREEIGFYGIIESLPDPTGIRKDWEQRRLTVDKNDRNRRFSFFHIQSPGTGDSRSSVRWLFNLDDQDELKILRMEPLGPKQRYIQRVDLEQDRANSIRSVLLSLIKAQNIEADPSSSSKLKWFYHGHKVSVGYGIGDDLICREMTIYEWENVDAELFDLIGLFNSMIKDENKRFERVATGQRR